MKIGTDWPVRESGARQEVDRRRGAETGAAQAKVP